MPNGAFNGLIINDETLPTIKSMAEGLPGGFFIYHADGNEEFIYISSQMVKIMGCGTEEEFRRYTGNSFRGLVHPDDLEATEAAINHQINSNSGMTDRVKYRIIKADGQMIWIDETGHFVHSEVYGDIFYVFVIEVTDEHDHRTHQRSQYEIKILDALCRDYLNVCLIDLQQKSVRNIKPGVDVAREYSVDTDVFYDYATLWAKYIKNRVHPEDAAMLADAVDPEALKKMLDKNGGFAITYRVLDGGVTHYYQAKVIRLDKYADMKDSVLLSFQNMDAVVEKEHAVAQKMETALAAADKANKAKTDFFFNLSHDIRTPMNAIIGFADLLSKYENNEDKRKDYIRKIQESSRYLLELINNVLDMARIENGKMTLNESVWNINQLIDFIASVFSGQIEKKNIHFESEVHVSRPDIMCDTTKMKEIFFNLVSNAVKYTPKGGSVFVRIKEIPSAREDYETIRTVIEDTGVGMSAGYLPHIFEDFSREENPNQRQIVGTGLGMPIVKKIVDLMGGYITVESELGKGTKITVILDCKIAANEDNKLHGILPDGDSLASFRGKRILLTEDNELNAEIALEILGELGFETERAECGEACIDMLQRAPEDYYTLILMDIQMLGMNGYQTARKIRGLSDNRAKIPIIAMTANAFEEDKVNALAAGMNGHIAKPIEIRKLVETLAEFCKR